MRRIAAAGDKERGAIAVIVALLMVVLLGFAAIAIDVAKLYSERAQLQNSADAVALAVARNCAVPSPTNACADITGNVRRLANENAVDGQSTVVDPVGLDISKRRVSATTMAKENRSAPNTVSLFFARALGFDSAQVSATSTVTWGSPSAGTTPFPLAFSVCQVSTTLEKGAQLLEAHNPNDNNDKGSPDCIYANNPVPGGFNWTREAAGVCGSSIDLSVSRSYSETGNDAPDNCATTLKSWAQSINDKKDVVVLLPVFDSASGTGSSATYHLAAFAAFKVQGWKFSGGTGLPFVFQNTSSSAGSNCTGSCRGIIGSFIRYVSLGDGYTLGPVSSFGATVVELTS
ncbi:pilus assembly protein TadG-related protein [Arthrobacter sp. UC242_113]|uniref:pilus assembly protein TadG-related protein n=1 Tax=Arthrobacter sp. UC242_113 TaxID=3374550 RepID=UPI00375847F1